MKNTAYLAGALACSMLMSCSTENKGAVTENPLREINWNLADLYQSISDPNIQKDKLLAEKLAAEFRKTYKDKLSVQNLADAIEMYEQILEGRAKLGSYSGLYVATRQDDASALAFAQSMSEWDSNISKNVVFFPIEIMKLEENSLAQEISKNQRLAKYKSWIYEVRKCKPHTLSTEIEEVLTQTQLVGASAWRKFYDEVLTRIEVPFNGRNVGLPELTKIANESPDSEERKQAFVAMSDKLRAENFYVRHIYNNIVLRDILGCKLRKFDKVESARNLDNNIEDETVDKLVDAVVEHYKDTSHRYYKIKAKLLGKDKIEYWDRAAPVHLSGLFKKNFSYEDGKKLVLDVYGDFSEKFRDIASEFMEKNWIDVYPKKGKQAGAFACWTPVHPYVMLNYFGHIYDVSTIAHELGHGIHFYLSMHNGPLLSEAPITLAETASLFAENLLAEYLYKNATTDEERIDLLCQKLDTVVASVMRQIAFFKFEKDVHELRKERELTCADISGLFLKHLREYLGDGVHVDDCIGDTWSYISHIFCSPFYVYGYAFGQLYVNALYECFKNDKTRFVDKYIAMLEKGGIDRYDEAASHFGLNPKTKEFWENGLKLIEKDIDVLEKLCEKRNNAR